MDTISVLNNLSKNGIGLQLRNLARARLSSDFEVLVEMGGGAH